MNIDALKALARLEKATEYSDGLFKESKYSKDIATINSFLIANRTCKDCRYCDEFKDDILHCNYFEQFFPTEIGKCNKWENR